VAEASVEVTTAATNAAEGPVHRISSLDQLTDPEQGELFLFSLQVADDALATNCLAGLVDAMSTSLRGDQAATERFNQKLAEYGFSPRDAAHYQRKLRIIAERCFRIHGDFPRLTRDSFPLGVPPGIGEVSYTLSVAACMPWLVSNSPEEPSVVRLLRQPVARRRR
jgi:hypothetical protein